MCHIIVACVTIFIALATLLKILHLMTSDQLIIIIHDVNPSQQCSALSTVSLSIGVMYSRYTPYRPEANQSIQITRIIKFPSVL